MSAVGNASPPGQHSRAPRQRCFRAARCFFNEGRSALEVTVRNMSETGARITGDELVCLPREFELHIHDGFGKFEIRHARRAWLRGNAIGLTFIDRPPPDPNDEAAQTRVT